MRFGVIALVLLVALVLSSTTAHAWDVLDRFKGDALYMVFEVVYRVDVSTSAGSGVALSTYSLHIVVEKLNRTHYSVSALASDIKYSFASSDIVFLHALIPLYMANLSSYFIELLYVPPSEGVTVNVVVPKDNVAPLLNSVARWYRLIEDTSGEVCQELTVDNVTVSKGVKYKMVSPRAEMVYDCPTGVLVSLKAYILGGTATDAKITMSVELSKLNFLNLTSIRPSTPESPQGTPTATAILLVVATAAISITALAMIFLAARKLKHTKGTSS